MADYLIQDTTLDAIADAINAKTGGSSAMTPAEMVTAIGSISDRMVINRTGTLLSVLGKDAEFEALLSLLTLHKASALVDFTFNGINMSIPLLPNGRNDILGKTFLTDGTMQNTMGVQINWNVAEVVNAIAFMGGQLQDLSSYAPMIDATLRVYSTIVPTSQT